MLRVTTRTSEGLFTLFTAKVKRAGVQEHEEVEGRFATRPSPPRRNIHAAEGRKLSRDAVA